MTQFHGVEPLYYKATKEEMTRAGRPFSLRYRLAAGWALPKFIRFATRRSDLVLCLNSAEHRFLVESNWCRPEKLQVLSHQIDAEFFFDRTIRPVVKRLLFVGQWGEAKGIRYLVEAFENLSREWPDLMLHCVGVRVGADRVREAFSEAVRPRVIVDSDVDRKDLITALNAADVFVFPSLFEAFGLALLEAMAAALPVVCTPVGIAADGVDDRAHALVVPCGSAAALETAVSAMLRDSALRARLGRAARERARRYLVEGGRPPLVGVVREQLAGGEQ